MKKFLGASLTSVIMLVIGICLLVNPGTFMKWLFYIVGAAAIILAGLKFYGAYRKNNIQGEIVTCIALFVLGIVLIVIQKAVLYIIPLVIGICILIYGLLKLRAAFAFKSTNENAFKKLAVSALIEIVLAILIICLSGLAIDIVLRIIGVVIIFTAAQNIFDTVVAKDDLKKPIEAHSEEAK